MSALLEVLGATLLIVGLYVLPIWGWVRLQEWLRRRRLRRQWDDLARGRGFDFPRVLPQ